MAGWAKLAHLRCALGKVTVQLRGIGGTPAHVFLQGPLEQRGQIEQRILHAFLTGTTERAAVTAAGAPGDDAAVTPAT